MSDLGRTELKVTFWGERGDEKEGDVLLAPVFARLRGGLLEQGAHVGAEDGDHLGLELGGQRLDEVGGGAAPRVRVRPLHVLPDVLLRVVLERLDVRLPQEQVRDHYPEWELQIFNNKGLIIRN